MKISFKTKFKTEKDILNHNGYGYATEKMLECLTTLGYEWSVNDVKADVSIAFDQPEHHERTPGQYNILYFPWESTALLKTRKPDWFEQLNDCDEVWTPSPVIASWLKNPIGLTTPVFVYEHGVDPIWKPSERTVDGTFKFLHLGSEALRKGGKEAMQAMRLAFPRNTDVEINMKVISKRKINNVLPRVNFINEIMTVPEMVQLFHDNHVYVYPSYGEGFGLTPLQAMSTGMPTITLPSWAPYREFLIPQLQVDSVLVNSPWPAHHPGKMFKPDINSLIESMRFSYENYSKVQAEQISVVTALQQRYDWLNLTREAFSSLEKRL